MVDYLNTKAERRRILELLILVTAITGAVNFFTTGIVHLFNSIATGDLQLMLLWCWLIFLLIMIIFWRVSESNLFSFEIVKNLNIIFIYDKKNKKFLEINNDHTPYYHNFSVFNKSINKFKELKKKTYLSISGEFYGGDYDYEVFNNIYDIFTYSVLATICRQFDDWDIKTFDDKNKKDYIKINYDDLPINLREENIILNTFAEDFRNARYIHNKPPLNDNYRTILYLPPKTRIKYRERAFSFKNKYFNLELDLMMINPFLFEKPYSLINDSLGQKDRFVKFKPFLYVSLKTNPYLALSSRSERDTDWAMNIIKSLEKCLITNEKDYIQKIKKDNPEICSLSKISVCSSN